MAQAALGVECLHHVSLPVADLARSMRFYSDVLGLAEIPRPPFDFPGAWFALGASGQLHLIAEGSRPTAPTFRTGKPVDSRDIHFAIRVRSFGAALRILRGHGYSETAEGLLQMRLNPRATAGFPQIYILDPDRHVIEINAEFLDEDGTRIA